MKLGYTAAGPPLIIAWHSGRSRVQRGGRAVIDDPDRRPFLIGGQIACFRALAVRRLDLLPVVVALVNRYPCAFNNHGPSRCIVTQDLGQFRRRRRIRLNALAE